MASDKLTAKGKFRLQITEDGKIQGDTGWVENQITNEGFRSFLVRSLGAISGSSQVSHVAIGSGGAPASNATTLTGEVEKRTTVTAATNGSTSAQFTATFSSSDSFVTNTQNLSNIGLFATSSGGTLFAGNTYNSSACATNQNVNITYSINFS